MPIGVVFARRDEAQMDIFQVRGAVASEFDWYVRGSLRIANLAINPYVEVESAEGPLRLDPLVRVNPSHGAGGTIDELV